MLSMSTSRENRRSSHSRLLWTAGKHLPRTAATASALCWVILAGASDAQAEIKFSDTGRQIRFGVLQHDLDGYGGTEDGTDIVLEYRGAPLPGAFWAIVLSPRPHLGMNVNTSGHTSSLYAGFTWLVDFGSAFYGSIDFGGAIHNGKLNETSSERAALGSRVLFHEAAEIGVRLGRDWRAGVRLDHMSNANLASHNEGITNLGIVFSRQF